MGLSNEKLLEAYRKMLMSRFFEDKEQQLLAEGKLDMMPHFLTGQEAVAIGVSGQLRQEDILFGTHRGVGVFIGKGMGLADLWAEILGKKTSPSKGRGRIHISDERLNIPFNPASLGADFSISVGTALATKMKKLDRVTVYFVGEGTCNQGEAHPSMNMAALWNLPIVFAVCTNQFCELAYYDEHYPTKDVAPRAAGYGIPYEIVDGQDVEVTTEAMLRAVEHARSGKGPYLIEYKTFRMAGHYAGDAGEYVKQEDLEEWRKKDPIDLCRNKLLERGAMTAEDDGKLRAEIKGDNEAAFAKAMADPDPTEEDLYSDVCEQEGVL